MGELVLALLPAVILVGLLWAVVTALSPRDTGMSDAERYQLDLAERSAQHYEAQVRAATAARAQLERSTRPSQNAEAMTANLAAARKNMERR